ncbi:inositol monophosphatase [Candidatus Sumerlaeota bacterium]|nr:inositol monophosphatase family protein [Candidatus Sumerlaeales bacterium]NLD62236.1 inositol monophosphatase [Candidatus Sumerlaeota bacterium]
MNTDLLNVLNAALDCAGGILMSHYGHLSRGDVGTKLNAMDLVTVADRESEGAIRELVGKCFPHHAILGEEKGGDYHRVDKGTRWIIDPLDGTTNFSHSYPQFCVSIGVEHNGVMEAAGVFAPFYGERFLAVRGKGATLNDRRIRVSDRQVMSDCLSVTGFPYERDRVGHFLNDWAAILPKVHGILRLGSAALDMCSVACGRLDFFWEEHLHAWDTAASWLIVEEAGGRVSGFDGSAFDPFGSETLASNGHVHDEVSGVLSGVRSGTVPGLFVTSMEKD